MNRRHLTEKESWKSLTHETPMNVAVDGEVNRFRKCCDAENSLFVEINRREETFLRFLAPLGDASSDELETRTFSWVSNCSVAMTFHSRRWQQSSHDFQRWASLPWRDCATTNYDTGWTNLELERWQSIESLSTNLASFKGDAGEWKPFLTFRRVLVEPLETFIELNIVWLCSSPRMIDWARASTRVITRCSDGLITRNNHRTRFWRRVSRAKSLKASKWNSIWLSRSEDEPKHCIWKPFLIH